MSFNLVSVQLWRCLAALVLCHATETPVASPGGLVALKKCALVCIARFKLHRNGGIETAGRGGDEERRGEEHLLANIILSTCQNISFNPPPPTLHPSPPTPPIGMALLLLFTEQLTQSSSVFED